jgi:hypothetical protein
MTRRSFRRIFYLTSIIPVWIACAQTEGGDLDDQNGDGDGDSSSGGGSSTGGIVITTTGGATSTGGGPAATG